MITINIGEQKLTVTKTEAIFAQDCLNLMQRDGHKYAQIHINILLQGAQNKAAQVRREAICRALGLELPHQTTQQGA